MKEAQVPGDLSGFPLEEAAWCWFGGRVVGLRFSCEEIILERREILILWEISRAFQPRWNVFLIRRWSAVCTVRLKSNGLEEQLKHRGKAWLFWQRTKHRSWCIWADNVGLIKSPGRCKIKVGSHLSKVPWGISYRFFLAFWATQGHWEHFLKKWPSPSTSSASKPRQEQLQRTLQDLKTQLVNIFVSEDIETLEAFLVSPVSTVK